MTEILIAGANGMVGRALMSAAYKAGCSVHALCRPSSLEDEAFGAALTTAEARLHPLELDQLDEIYDICRTVDCLVSALDIMAVDELPLLEVALAAQTGRIVPSGYGTDPTSASVGSCLVFDRKAKAQDFLKSKQAPYTFFHTDGFFSHWIATLGNVFNAASARPPKLVPVYGTGNVQGRFVDVPDVATVAVRALFDPLALRREVHVAPFPLTQNEIIQTWEALSGRSVQREVVSASDLEEAIAQATKLGDVMSRAINELHRSMWIQGNALPTRSDVLEVTEVYPDMEFRSAKSFLAHGYLP